LPPSFLAVPRYFNHTSVGPCPSQNRACATNAHGSSDGLSLTIEEMYSHSRLWQRKYV